MQLHFVGEYAYFLHIFPAKFMPYSLFVIHVLQSFTFQSILSYAPNVNHDI